MDRTWFGRAKRILGPTICTQTMDNKMQRNCVSLLLRSRGPGSRDCFGHIKGYPASESLSSVIYQWLFYIKAVEEITHRILIHQSFSKPFYCKEAYYNDKGNNVEQIKQQKRPVTVWAYCSDQPNRMGQRQYFRQRSDKSRQIRNWKHYPWKEKHRWYTTRKIKIKVVDCFYERRYQHRQCRKHNTG